MRRAFERLGLPDPYFQICDGNLTNALFYVERDRSGKVIGYEFIAHRITKRGVAKHGDWAIALSHSTMNCCTSAYLSVEECIDSDKIVKDIESFQSSANHPMFLLCIVFSMLAEDAKER